MIANIETRIQNILCDQLSLQPEEVTQDAQLFDDLGCDSLHPVEIALKIEEEFNICITDEEIDSSFTVADWIEIVKSKTKTQ